MILMLRKPITFINIFLIVLISCNQTPKTVLLERLTFENNLVFPDTTYELTLSYFGMHCPCPQWATPENTAFYQRSLGLADIPVDSLFVTILPANQNTKNPFELEEVDSSYTFVFKGRMSSNIYKWQGEDGRIWENRVFKYDEVRK